MSYIHLGWDAHAETCRAKRRSFSRGSAVPAPELLLLQKETKLMVEMRGSVEVSRILAKEHGPVKPEKQHLG